MDYRGKIEFDREFASVLRKVEASLGEPGTTLNLGSDDGIEYGIEKGTGRPLEKRKGCWFYADKRGD